MPVRVKFPDGVERDVPSSLRAVSTGSSSTLTEVPNDSPDWRFIPGRWWLASGTEEEALKREGSVSLVSPGNTTDLS